MKQHVSTILIVIFFLIGCAPRNKSLPGFQELFHEVQPIEVAYKSENSTGRNEVFYTTLSFDRAADVVYKQCLAQGFQCRSAKRVNSKRSIYQISFQSGKRDQAFIIISDNKIDIDSRGVPKLDAARGQGATIEYVSSHEY